MLWMYKRFGLLAAGGITFGILQAWANIDWNSILYQFVATWLSAISSLLFGGSLDTTAGTTSSLFSSFL